MTKKTNIFFFIFIGFILNILFYLFSDNYRYFLQSLKSEKNINDEFNIDLNNIVEIKESKKEESLFAGLSKNFQEEDTKEEKIKRQSLKKELLKKNQENIEKKQDDKKEEKVIVEFRKNKEDIKLTKIEKNILNELKEYNLKEVKVHPRLFGLTNEYPDKYFEYYNKDLTIYFFGNKPFNDLKDIFEVLTHELPFSIKQVDNFGQKSFYINLNPLFDDNYVRIVIQKSNRTFGIQIKKDLYNKIKNKLGLIFKK